MNFSIRRLSTTAADFSQQMDALLVWEAVSDAQVQQRVADIVADVRSRGDAALVAYTNQFDRRQVSNACELEITQAQLQAASFFATSYA